MVLPGFYLIRSGEGFQPNEALGGWSLNFEASQRHLILVAGKRVTAYSNSEEEAVNFTEIVPFSVEDMLKENGGKYSKGPDWNPYAVEDGLLITGQNPASSEKVAELLLKKLGGSAEYWSFLGPGVQPQHPALNINLNFTSFPVPAAFSRRRNPWKLPPDRILPQPPYKPHR